MSCKFHDAVDGYLVRSDSASGTLVMLEWWQQLTSNYLPKGCRGIQVCACLWDVSFEHTARPSAFELKFDLVFVLGYHGFQRVYI